MAGIFSDLNEVILMGNAVKEPEVKFTVNGSKYCLLSIATNRSYKQEEEWKDETTFHNVVLWGRLAEHAEERILKGTRVHIKGRIVNRSWKDEERDVTRYRTEIVANSLILIARYQQKEGNEKEPTEQQKRGKGNKDFVDDMLNNVQ